MADAGSTLSPSEVEAVLREYVALGLTRLGAIRAAVAEEKLERTPEGRLRVRARSVPPGRRLWGL